MLHLKIGWFLTDLDAPDMGNFLLIPGSHRGKFPRSDADAVALSSPSRFQEVDEIDAGVPGAEQVLLRAGDALLFHNALWHAVSRNRSQVRRKNVFFVYAPLWMRLGDRMSSSPELIARADPVRRQLLGALAEESGGVHPGDEHAPLIHLFEGKATRKCGGEGGRLCSRRQPVTSPPCPVALLPAAHAVRWPTLRASVGVTSRKLPR